MDIGQKWGLSLASLMFLMSLVQCQNQTSSNTTSMEPSKEPMEPVVPGTLSIGNGNVFQSPDIFGASPFSLQTDPVTGEVNFHTKTVDVQTINEKRDKEEADKKAELHQDLQTRVSSSAQLPLEGREEEVEEGEYADDWRQPIDRADIDYYEDDVPQAREPIMVPQNGPPRPTTTEESFLSIFESLFGGEEKKVDPPPKPFKSSYRQPYPTPSSYTTELTRMITRPPMMTSERRPPHTTDPTVQHSDRVNYQPSKTVYDPYQQVRPGVRPVVTPERPYQEEEEEPYSTLPERPHYPPRPVEQTYQTPPPRKESEKYSTKRPVVVAYEASSPKPTEPSTTVRTTTHALTTRRSTTTERVVETTTAQHEWKTVSDNRLDHNVHKKENIDRQDVGENEVVNPQSDYFNFINLPVHYSTKDTAIPLISGSYANTKVQGMGASKYDNSNGKHSNHNYERTSTTRRPSYWSSTRRTSSKAPSTQSNKRITDFDTADYEDVAIGDSADFGGYGSKAGAKYEPEPQRKTTTRTTTVGSTVTSPTTTSTIRTTINRWSTETARPTTKQPTRYTPSRPSYRETTRPPVRDTFKPEIKEKTTTTTQIRETTRPQIFTRETTTKSSPKVTEYDEYEYETYPANVKPIPNPISSTTSTSQKPLDVIPQETRTRTTAKPKEPEYEYYDYDTEVPLEPPTTSTAKPLSTTTTTRTTTTTSAPTTSATQKHKFRYPSLSKDKIRRPEEKVDIVVPTKLETTSTSTTTTTRAPSTTLSYFQRPTTVKTQPAPVFEEYENEDKGGDIELVPAKSGLSGPFKRPGSDYPTSEYTTEFTVGVVQGQGHGQSQSVYGGQRPNYGQGHYVASSIASSAFSPDDGPFRPIARPAGISASFQVVGPEDNKKTVENIPEQFYKNPESDTHEPHEFIPSPQFHRPHTSPFAVGNTKSEKPVKPTEFYQPSKNEIISVKPKKPLPTSNQEFINYSEVKPDHRPFYQKPTEETFPRPNPKPEDEDYNIFDGKPSKQQNVELSVDYDGIQMEPKPGQYVIFPKPQLNSEINENQVKKGNTPIPHYHTTEPNTGKPERVEETQQQVASQYPRPHWEKTTGKPVYLANSQGAASPVRNPNFTPQMSPNLIPPYNSPKYRKPIPQPGAPPIRNNYNDGGYPKPAPNLPNILPQFRPNAKVHGGRPHRPMPPNRRKENFPYRIQNDPLMHRDFKVEEDSGPKMNFHRGYEEMGIQKRLGSVQDLGPPRRVQRTPGPVTTLQMLQQTQGTKQKVPSTREDQLNLDKPLVPPAFKPLKDNKKQVYVVYPVKTPFNSNIKIEDPEKIEYNYNLTHNQVPLLKPSKKREPPKKPNFPYGFITPDDTIKKKDKEDEEEQKRVGEPVRPNIQDYMPSAGHIGHNNMNQNERIDMNLHMQSNNQWNQMGSSETAVPPTQYHTILKNSNASELTLGAVMHTLPGDVTSGGGPVRGDVTSVGLGDVTSGAVRGDVMSVSMSDVTGLHVNERLNNGKIVTVSMPLDVRNQEEETQGFQAPFQASTGWNMVQGEDQQLEEKEHTDTSSSSNTTFNIHQFKPQLIGGFKPIYSTQEPDPEVPKDVQ